MEPRQRLVRLLEHVVPRIVPKKFDMSSWLEWKVPIPDDADRYSAPPHPMPGDCKTAACLAGWGASDPLLQAEGLVFMPHNVGARYWNWTIRTDRDGHLNLARFFGIGETMAQLLFYTALPPGEDPRPALAARIGFALDHPHMDEATLLALLPDVGPALDGLPAEQDYHPTLRANQQSLSDVSHWDVR